MCAFVCFTCIQKLVDPMSCNVTYREDQRSLSLTPSSLDAVSWRDRAKEEQGSQISSQIMLTVRSVRLAGINRQHSHTCCTELWVQSAVSRQGGEGGVQKVFVLQGSYLRHYSSLSFERRRNDRYVGWAQKKKTIGDLSQGNILTKTLTLNKG